MFLMNLGLPSLWDKDEGRNATAALEMLKSGDYIVPCFNSELRVDKPALLYWLQVVAYKLFGIHEFSARLPSALASLLTLLVCYELGRSLFSKTTGLLAALMLGSTPLMCGVARFANPDALLQLFIVSILFCFWQSQRGGTWWFLATGAAAGLAALAKGPVGAILPGMVIAIYCWWTGQVRAIFRPALALAAVMFLLVALPWYIVVAVETKAKFLTGFLLHHNVNRFLAPLESHDGTFLYYPAAMFVGAAPWSVFWWLMWRPTYGSFRRRTANPLLIIERSTEPASLSSACPPGSITNKRQDGGIRLPVLGELARGGVGVFSWPRRNYPITFCRPCCLVPCWLRTAHPLVPREFGRRPGSCIAVCSASRCRTRRRGRDTDGRRRPSRNAPA